MKNSTYVFVISQDFLMSNLCLGIFFLNKQAQKYMENVQLTLYIGHDIFCNNSHFLFIYFFYFFYFKMFHHMILDFLLNKGLQYWFDCYLDN